MNNVLSFPWGWLARQPERQQSEQDAATNYSEASVNPLEHPSLPNPNHFLEVHAYFKQRLQHTNFDDLCELSYGDFQAEIDLLRRTIPHHTCHHLGLENLPASDNLYTWFGPFKYFVDSIVVQLAKLYQKLPRNEYGMVKVQKRHSGDSGRVRASLERDLEDGGKYGPPSSPSYLANEDEYDEFRRLGYQLRLETEGLFCVVEPLRKYYPQDIAAIVNAHIVHSSASIPQYPWHPWKLSREASEDTALLLTHLTSKMPRAKSAPPRITAREPRTPRCNQTASAMMEIGTGSTVEVKNTTSEAELQANVSASLSRHKKRNIKVVSTPDSPAYRRSDRKREPRILFHGVVSQSTITGSRKRRTGTALDASYKDKAEQNVDNAAPPLLTKSRKRPAPDAPEASFKPAMEEKPDLPIGSKRKKHAKKTTPKPMSVQTSNDDGISVVILSPPPQSDPPTIDKHNSSVMTHGRRQCPTDLKVNIPTMIVHSNCNKVASEANVLSKTVLNKKTRITEPRCLVQAIHDGSEVQQFNSHEIQTHFQVRANLDHYMAELGEVGPPAGQSATGYEQSQNDVGISKNNRGKRDKRELEYGTNTLYSPVIPESPNMERQGRGKTGKAVRWADDVRPDSGCFLFQVNIANDEREHDFAKDRNQGDNLSIGGSNGDEEKIHPGHGPDKENEECLFNANTEGIPPPTSLGVTPSPPNVMQCSADGITVRALSGRHGDSLATSSQPLSMVDIYHAYQLYGCGRKARNLASNKKYELPRRRLHLSGRRPGAPAAVRKAEFVRSRSVSPEERWVKQGEME